MPYTILATPTVVADPDAVVLLAEADTNIADAKWRGASGGHQFASANLDTGISTNVVEVVIVTDADAADATGAVVAAAATTINMAGNMDDSETAMTVTNGAVFPTAPFTVIVETEQMRVTAVATHVLTVTRGYDGTTAAAHVDTTAVTQYIDEATTVFDVDDATTILVGNHLKIATGGTEEMKVTAKSTNRITVTRGYASTTPAVIANGAAIWKVYGDDTIADLLDESDIFLEQRGSSVSSLS